MTASRIVVKKKIRICVLDIARTVCNNRTNVRTKRGRKQVKRDQVVKWAKTATEEELDEAMEAIKSFHATATIQKTDPALPAASHHTQQ